MKLGLLTVPFGSWSLDDVADWAAANGYPTLEVAAWPRSSGDARRYAGVCHLDVDDLSDTRASEIVDEVAQRGVSICGLGFYPNLLHPDAEHRASVREHLKKVIVAASRLDVGVVNTFIGADQRRSLAENWEAARDIWPEVVGHATDHGVRIAIENCPMIFSADEWPSGHNLAYSPSMWRTMLEEFGETVGLNFDPSHLVWQMIDIERAILEFGERFYFFQAKDVLIDREGLYEHGVMSTGIGWQVPRLPGLGDVPWDRVFNALYRVGYDGPIVVEHEDKGFEGTDELVERGFRLARDQLAPWIH
jgi:sugar phosphate isomerase/epimerase